MGFRGSIASETTTPVLPPNQPGLSARLQFGAAACGAASALVGVAVLAGWWFQVPILKSTLPGVVSMKPNTALTLVLAGAALALLSPSPLSTRRARGGQFLALLVMLIGGLTLCEFVLDWRLGIDELLFKDDPNATATLIPGRMAPSTAVGFFLLGLALLGIGWEPRRDFRPAEMLALVAAVVGLSSLVEYAVGQPILYGFGQYTRMALHTAAGFVVLSAGVLLARPAQGMVGAFCSGRIRRPEQATYAVMALAFLLVLAGGGWFYHAQEQQVRRKAEAELTAIARLKAEQIVQWRAERRGDAGALASNQFFVEGVARWMANPQSETAGKILADFRGLQQYSHYHNVLLVDGRGQVRLSLSDRPPAFHEDTVQALATAFRTRRPVLTDLHIPPGDPTPHVEVIAPLFAGNERTSEPIGAVVLQYEARQFLYPLIQSWPTPSSSAETLLARREGDSVLFLNELRHRSDTAFKLRFPLTQQDVPAVMAVRDREGLFHGTDYRGVPVLSALARIPDSPWFLVAKMDEAEALAEWRFRANLIEVVILVLALALAITARMIWEQRRRHRALSEAAAALRRVNRAYRVLSDCGQAMARASDEPQLLRRVCQLLIEQGGYRLAWVGLAEDDAARSVRPVAQAGFEAGYLERLHLTWADTERGRGPTGTAIRTGQPSAAQDILHDPRFEPWRAEALQCGYAAAAALPLTGPGRTLGALNVCAAEAHAFDAPELKLLEELAGDLAFGLGALRLRAERDQAAEEIRQLNADLERRVRERTAQLEAAIQEMSAFSYSISHDLRTPLRAIDGYARILADEHTARLDAEGRRVLGVISSEAQRMGELIDALLNFSRLGRRGLANQEIDMTALVNAAVAEAAASLPPRNVRWEVAPLLPARGDEALVRQVWGHLIANALKFTGAREPAVIRIGSRAENGEVIYHVADNGVGFDMRYVAKLFGVFQRLHSVEEFPGTGIGLALVQRIIHRHGGRVWAEGKVGEGATFYFSLPAQT